jgi:hypothetical protein
VLRVRGIAVPDAIREHILAQQDPERLERWLEKAAVATSVTEVVDGAAPQGWGKLPKNGEQAAR